MKIVEWAEAGMQAWRPGTEARLHASEASGAKSLCVGEQWFEPGVGTPLARHAVDVEEVISVIAGVAEVSVEDETRLVRAGQAVIIPGGAAHRLVATEDGPLHIWFVLSASAPAIFLVDEPGAAIVMGASDASHRLSPEQA
jgi:quercetin dioxygenase-like cupin family protein